MNVPHPGRHDVTNLHCTALRGDQQAQVSDSNKELLQSPKRKLRVTLKGRLKEEESSTC